MVFVSVPHVITSSLHVAVPLQSTVQVPEQVTRNFSQPSLTAQRTTNSAVAATVITHSFDPSLSSISIRQFAFAAHVTVFFWEFLFTTWAQQSALALQIVNAVFPPSVIHFSAEE